MVVLGFSICVQDVTHPLSRSCVQQPYELLQRVQQLYELLQRVQKLLYMSFDNQATALGVVTTSTTYGQEEGTEIPENSHDSTQTYHTVGSSSNRTSGDTNRAHASDTLHMEQRKDTEQEGR